MPKDAADIAGEATAGPTGAARVGAGLREVRERAYITLASAASELHIRPEFLEAIENGDLSKLPGPAYQTGFVRSYAQYLGLDPDEILRRFRAEGLGVKTKAALTFPAPVPDSAVPSGAIWFVGILAACLGYGFYYHHTAQETRIADLVPPVPAELAPLALPPKPPAASPAPAAEKPSQASPAVPSAIDSAAAATPAPAPAAPDQAALPPATAVPGPALPAQGKAILATGDAWIEVRDAANNIVFSQILHAGQSWPVPQLAGLTMSTGNAGGTEITLDGKAGAPLGNTGAVLRAYALTAPAPKSPPAASSKPAAPQPTASAN